LASFPTFDPNKFINRFTPEEWLSLLKSPDTPLINRAIQGLYSPGSIFKIVMASGALATGVITDQTTFFCGGSAEFYGHPFSCWLKGGHGALGFYNAIRYSCNIYFYNIARRMGIEEIAIFAQKFGLGAKTGIDLPGEKEGLVPTPEWKKKTRNAAWYPGETISVGIGQGPLQVTPLQIAAMTALVANRGIRFRPHLLCGEVPSKGQQSERISIESDVLEKVIEGMWRSVNEQGTGQAARVENFNVCGKTGSTQTVSLEKAEKMAPQMKQKKTHSWFTGFAPRDNPQVVVTVLVEFGGTGGATAAPLAQRIFALYQDKYDRQASAREFPDRGDPHLQLVSLGSRQLLYEATRLGLDQFGHPLFDDFHRLQNASGLFSLYSRSYGSSPVWPFGFWPDDRRRQELGPSGFYWGTAIRAR
jgi:penicillin-binding protein 2